MRVLLGAPRCLAAVAIALLSQNESHAQPAPNLSSSEAQRLETAVQRNPSDRGARSRLLDHYYLDKSVTPKDAITARRRHILWLIENTPEAPLAGSAQATIDPAGHYLADAEGYGLASKAWRSQTERSDAKAAVLVNAAYFFKTEDKEYAVNLLQRAVALDSKNKEAGARLGDEYALIILGVTLENRNHYPLKADPALAQSSLAESAREALASSHNPYVLAKAGYMLAWQGTIVHASGQIAFDPLPLATSAAERAVSFAPGEQDVAAFRHNTLELVRMSGQRGRVQKNAPQARAQAQGVSEPATAPVHGASTKENDLKRISTGMSRRDVLKIGAPSGRITMGDDGHLIEVFQYTGNTTLQAGTVRLTDGIVSSIQIQ